MKQLYRERDEYKTMEVNMSEASKDPIDASDEAWVIGFSLLRRFLEMPEDTRISDFTKADASEVVVCREGRLVAILSRSSNGKWECAMEDLPKLARKEFMDIAGEYVNARVVIRE